MNIGIIGIGTVGMGVLNIINDERERLETYIGEAINICYACARSERDLPTKETTYTNAWQEIINDDSIDVVVELMGGIETAYDIVLGAITNGKHVVTANKALIAHYAHDIFAAANKAGVKVYFEAAVGGGIPILTTMQESLIANNFIEIQGIINGTTNFILSKMETEGYEYNEIYQIANDLGYLETDPSLDIDGVDAAHKLTILAMLAYKKFIPFEKVHSKGISSIAKVDIDIASDWGYRIKLLANAMKIEDAIALDICPTLINKDDLFANVMNEFNACKLIGDRTGDVIIYGKGAGRYPTASAVVADIMKISQKTKWDMNYQKTTDIRAISKSKYYIRMTSEPINWNKDALGIIKEYKSEDNYAIITKEMEIEDLKKILDNNIYNYMKVK